jgi:hypothetical protein
MSVSVSGAGEAMAAVQAPFTAIEARAHEVSSAQEALLGRIREQRALLQARERAREGMSVEAVSASGGFDAAVVAGAPASSAAAGAAGDAPGASASRDDGDLSVVELCALMEGVALYTERAKALRARMDATSARAAKLQARTAKVAQHRQTRADQDLARAEGERAREEQLKATVSAQAVKGTSRRRSKKGGRRRGDQASESGSESGGASASGDSGAEGAPGGGA